MAELEQRLNSAPERQAIERSQTPGEPTGATAEPGWTNEEPDPVDILLRKAEQMGAGVFDEDLEELFKDLQPLTVEAPAAPMECLMVEAPAATMECLTAEAPAAPTPSAAQRTTVSRCNLVLGDSIAKHLDLPVALETLP